MLPAVAMTVGSTHCVCTQKDGQAEFTLAAGYTCKADISPRQRRLSILAQTVPK